MPGMRAPGLYTAPGGMRQNVRELSQWHWLFRVVYDARSGLLAAPCSISGGHLGESSVIEARQDRARKELSNGGAPADVTEHIFERHVFVCTGGDWCATIDGDGLGLHARLKKAVKAAGLNGRVRVNHSGCLDQCGFGPLIVVYPENVWYWGAQPEDVDEIVREHLLGGRPVRRLVYRNKPGKNKLQRDDRSQPIGRPERREDA